MCQKVEIPYFFPSILESQISGFSPGQCGPGHCGLEKTDGYKSLRWFRRHVVIDIDEQKFMDDMMISYLYVFIILIDYVLW